MSDALLASELRSIDLFDELDDAQLAEWAAVAEHRSYRPGEHLTEQGTEPPGVILLLEGAVRVLLVDEGRIEPVGRQQAPTWIGAIAVITRGLIGVRIEAEVPSRIALVASDDFRRLALAQPTVHDRVMRQVAPVMSQITASEQNRERLASLGTMAAGLAHELNNPAAAAQRAAAQMAEALDVLASTIGHFVEAGIERTEAEQLVALQREILGSASARTPLGALDATDALTASDAEEQLAFAMEDMGVEEAWQIAEPLAAAGVDVETLGRIGELAGSGAGPALEWIAASLTASGLAGELRESAERMASLVSAVKSYAYMDRASVVEGDIHEGLETTLVVLGHKLKHTEIEVVRDYDRSIPPVTMRGSELNQVWTNLLDNAIDVLGERGTITLQTEHAGPLATVRVIDDGPGIPAEQRSRIFDAFYTTKDVGRGTGLGLDTVRRIVVDRHDGSVDVESEPGRTAFRVCVPIAGSGVGG